MLDKTLTDPAVLSGRYAGSPAYEALSDKDLLEWFVQRHEEAAFTALVRRHGPMVLGVCRRVLRHSHDAEDAFQATFLVLAKKADRLRRPELLANWLYGVAYRTALQARQRGARRSVREREAASMSAPNGESELESKELRRILDEELSRLPEKYRAPLILCYLEGKTNEEAAHVLGWPSGSMSHRLARGRELLRERLQVRLAGLTILLPAILLADHFRPGSVPPLLIESTVQAATLVAAGAKLATISSGVISSSVRELMDLTLNSMEPSRWQWLFVALLLLVSLFGVGAAVCVAADGWPFFDSGSCTSSP